MRRGDNSSALAQTIILGVIALAVLIPVGFIAVILVNQGKDEIAIAFIAPLAGTIIAFFFAHGSSFLAQVGATGQRADLIGIIQPFLQQQNGMMNPTNGPINEPASLSNPPIPTIPNVPSGSTGTG